MNRLIRQLIIKLIIVAIIISVFTYIVSIMCPHLDQSNLYDVNGICVDTYSEPYGKHGSAYYITMNNGTTYQIIYNLLSDVGKIKDLRGQNLKFCAVDRKVFKPLIVGWNDNAEIRQRTIDETNQQHSKSRIAAFVILIVFGIIFLLPSIFRITEKRDQIKETVWKKKKREAKKQRFADKQLDSNVSNKKRPPNMSKKKWKHRNKH